MTAASHTLFTLTLWLALAALRLWSEPGHPAARFATLPTRCPNQFGQ
jgi:hypothetical protein